MGTYTSALHKARQAGYNIRVCVKIINEAADVLLIQRAAADNYGGIWEVPGGAVETGEDIKAAAVREVLEETGLTISSGQLRYITFFDFENIETGKHTRKFVFTATAVGSVRVSHEHDAFSWMTPQQLAALKRQSAHPSGYEIWDDHYKVARLKAAMP